MGIWVLFWGLLYCYVVEYYFIISLGGGGICSSHHYLQYSPPPCYPIHHWDVVLHWPGLCLEWWDVALQKRLAWALFVLLYVVSQQSWFGLFVLHFSILLPSPLQLAQPVLRGSLWSPRVPPPPTPFVRVRGEWKEILMNTGGKTKEISMKNTGVKVLITSVGIIIYSNEKYKIRLHLAEAVL